jgi:DNA-binding MarR family transcriptional regulator
VDSDQQELRRQGRLDERELHAWQTFFQMQEVLRGRIEQQLQACSGLSLADYSVLTVLSGAPGGRLRAYRLGATLGWEKSRLHHQLTRMAKRGLVERRCGDSRAIYVEMTPQGLTALAQAAPGHSRHVRQLVIDRLTPQQLDQLTRISAAILVPLQDDQQTGDSGTD